MIITAQGISVLVMFLCGIGIGIILDGFRIFWQNRRHWALYRVHRFFEMLLWALLGLATFYFLFLIKGGAWRYLDPIAQIMGIIMYDAWLKRVFRAVGRVVHFLVVRPSYFIGHLFVATIRMLLKVVVLFVKFLLQPFFRKKRKVL